MVVTYNTGLAHTYPDILEKGDYFLRRLDRIPFMYDIVVFESNLWTKDISSLASRNRTREFLVIRFHFFD